MPKLESRPKINQNPAALGAEKSMSLLGSSQLVDDLHTLGQLCDIRG
jgi:hypothetical protein